ncbi:MAG: DUF3800 domain-containing protein [Bacillota bacterium]|nr:DUF3800 domain-containing protein [Bacillota bacterium]
MKTLSIFIDESGDFGEYEAHSPYYIISIVLHDQDKSISEEVDKLENSLSDIGYPNHCVHTGPLIRGEEEYRLIDIDERKSILRRMKTFLTHVDISYKSFYIEKKHIEDEVIAINKLSKQLAAFIREQMSYFYGFDKVIVYYDNGQIQVSKILASVFGILIDNVDFRKVIPSEYRLFQLADLLCTLKLVRLKAEAKTLSRSELYFFEDEKTLKKQYFKLMDAKENK